MTGGWIRKDFRKWIPTKAGGHMKIGVLQQLDKKLTEGENRLADIVAKGHVRVVSNNDFLGIQINAASRVKSALNFLTEQFNGLDRFHEISADVETSSSEMPTVLLIDPITLRISRLPHKFM